MRLIKLIILFFFIILSNIGYAGTRHPLVEDSRYIDFGRKFPHVGRLCGSYRDGKIFCASSVAIRKRIILTAAHVVKNADKCVIHINNKKIHVKNIVCHRDFEEDNFGWYDIAICSLNEDIGLESYPVLYQENNEVNKKCTISGFGLNGTFDSGCIYSDTERRAGSNTIDQIERGLLICTPSRHMSDTSPSDLEFLISSGDSGGGLFIDDRLAGINSCVMAIDKKPDSTYGDESGHTRISDHIEWINLNIEEMDR